MITNIGITKINYHCYWGHPGMKVELALAYNSLTSGHVVTKIWPAHEHFRAFNALFGSLSMCESHSWLSSISSRSFTNSFHICHFLLLYVHFYPWSLFLIQVFLTIYFKIKRIVAFLTCLRLFLMLSVYILV